MAIGAGTLARLELAVGVVGIVATASLAVFFAIGGPFGSINDWSIGLLGVLSGALVVAARRPADTVAVVIGLAGAAVVVVGAGLVISSSTGFVLAGFVESVGFALVGVWLILRSRAGDLADARLALIAGVLMVFGIAVLPDLLARIDRMEDVTMLGYLGWVGWLGIFILYPIWAIRAGRKMAAEG